MKYIAWLMLLVLAACKTQVAGLQQDPSFDKAALRASPILIAGVVEVNKKPQVAEVVHRGNVLRQAILKERKGLMLVQTQALVDKLGESTMLQLWQAYQAHGGVDTKVLGKIHQLFPQARYIVLSRIEQNQTRQYRDTSEEDETDWEGKPTGRFRYTISQVAERNMTVSLLFYDIKSKIIAWSGQVQDSDAIVNESTDTFNKNNSIGESIIAGMTSQMVGNLTGGFMGLKEPDKPAIPPVDPLLVRIYQGFAENLPE